MRRIKLKSFTLLEMLIVMVIIWILAVVLCESYITISKIALRVEQEKNLSEESLVLTQIFQSISDEATIDYSKYDADSLAESKWFTDILYLTWWQWSGAKIYTTWDYCLDLDWELQPTDDGEYDNIAETVKNALTWCMLVLEKEGNSSEPTILTTQWKKVITSKVMFRIVPYDSDENYFMNDTDATVINSLHQPAFWVFMHLYAPLYQPIWTNKIDQSLQLFFNLNL